MNETIKKKNLFDDILKLQGKGILKNKKTKKNFKRKRYC